jgi:hypothetical protein
MPKNDLTMKRGLKELAEETGVTPSYLCRVFKKTMGVTIGAYIKEFERVTSDLESESSFSPDSALPRLELRTGLVTTAKAIESPIAEKDLAIAAEALDLNFDFDQWFMNGGFNQEDFWSDFTTNDDFMTDNVLNQRECAVNGASSI